MIVSTSAFSAQTISKTVLVDRDIFSLMMGKRVKVRISEFLANKSINKINTFIDHYPSEVFHGQWRRMLKKYKST